MSDPSTRLISQPANRTERFCSRCGTEMIPQVEGERERPTCPACGHIVFGRFTIGVGGLLRHQGKVLLIQRAQNPGRGRWTLPGGYVEEDEAPHAAIVREVLEETGLRVSVAGLIAIRHAQGPENQNAYYVFAMHLEGPASDLKTAGDGKEVAQAVWTLPQDLGKLGGLGLISQWVIEMCPDTAAGLQVTPSPTPPPGHAWTVLYSNSPIPP